MVATASKTTDTETKEAPLTERSVAAAHEAIDNLSARIAKTEKSVRDMVNGSSQNFAEKQEEFKTRMDESVNGVRGYVQENPLMAAGIAFAAGAVVAALMRR
ncbi:hypothetical protein [Marinimicrobium sp. ABcell2]|uniref:glycine zipper domain-containing protein n=1 Tax=Marinimicrobium sp. ABcell2 TaxID=3069751 RepID=UPI0027ADF150|nr:hypothetical protein [Marinimicrobium sp. ABcell2]MDQ2077200.1 hypothetical protein [Marinimicrobium sp. ABcell2]